MALTPSCREATYGSPAAGRARHRRWYTGAPRGSGGIGRRASLRSWWPKGRRGSSPFFRTTSRFQKTCPDCYPSTVTHFPAIAKHAPRLVTLARIRLAQDKQSPLKIIGSHQLLVIPLPKSFSGLVGLPSGRARGPDLSVEAAEPRVGRTGKPRQHSHLLQCERALIFVHGAAADTPAERGESARVGVLARCSFGVIAEIGLRAGDDERDCRTRKFVHRFAVPVFPEQALRSRGAAG